MNAEAEAHATVSQVGITVIYSHLKMQSWATEYRRPLVSFMWAVLLPSRPLDPISFIIIIN